MPLLLRRRSVLDLLNVNADSEDLPRPHSEGLSAPAPLSPWPVSDNGLPTSRLSHELLREDVPDDNRSTTASSSDASRKRFSMLKLRNYSESHLAARAKEHAANAREERPPLPTVVSNETVPAIVRTAPTMEHGEVNHDGDRKRPLLFKRSMSKNRDADAKQPRKSSEYRRGEKPKSSLKWRKMQGRSTGLEDLARLSSINANTQGAPPSYGDNSNSALALPVSDPRFSESRDSDGSNGSTGDVYGQTTTTTHTVSTHTTFFKLPRRNKNRNSLFPLPVKIPPPGDRQAQANEPATPRASMSAYSTKSLRASDARSPPATALQRRHTETSPIKQRNEHPPLPNAHSALARGSLAFTEPGLGDIGRNDSQRSINSSTSSPLRPPMRLSLRNRASTASSVGQVSQDMDTPPPFPTSGRNSSSTTGRSSLGGFLTLSRFRQGSQPDSPRHGSPGTRSKSNSFALSREAVLVIPEREEGDTPSKYLERLEAAVARSMIAGILSKSADPFAQAVLRSYTRRFPFFGEPIDMSLRKFLLEAELPKETQQVDRVIQAFADRYHECNPGIFISPDQAYIVAFSLMMLHTDAFNKNNKRKMQKHDYIKNTSGQHVADEVLGCFYDNICYTPFVHYEEEVDINGERVLPFRPKPKSKLKGAITDTAGKKPSGPVDPYNLLVDQKLDVLRPLVKEAIAFDDPYNYRAAGQGDLDPRYLQRAFTHTGILQIISARSRPTAYEGQLTSNNANPAETQAGIIDLKITKVGTLWRKAMKKKKARSPWQEWGAILTGSQLYLFKNVHWAKGLVHQFMAQQKPNQPRVPVIFKPPLPDFKPDALIKTDNAVALVDATYNRHKHAFTFFRPGGHEEVMLADNESELNDWLALINYAAAFRAAGVRIRGMVGGHEEDLRRRDVHRLDSTHSIQSIQSATGAVTVRSGGLSPQLQRQVMAARRQIMVQKIAETEKEIVEAVKGLEDLLRDGRHLLILAPILPRSREDVLHAAAKADAVVKWLRRDIWRLKCHRDILAMDVRLDGVSAGELQALTEKQLVTVDGAKRERAPSLLRQISSKMGPGAAVPARSPPQSPTSPARSGRSGRPSTTGSIETFMGGDVFQTPPESAAEERKPTEGYQLPPLQLNIQQRDEHRASVTSTLLSVSDARASSLSHASSTSSMRPTPVDQRRGSEQASEVPSSKDVVTPTPSYEEQDVEKLARTLVAPEGALTGTSSRLNLDGTPPATAATPDSKSKSVRKSLQKTLRDAHQNAGSVHRHRRGKESDSTVRSAGTGAGGGGGGEIEEEAEGTPGLQREKGRFILHGKQASVIQFGSEWPNERMRARRERWRRDSGGSVEVGEGELETPRPGKGEEGRLGGSAGMREDGVEVDAEDTDGESEGTATSYTLREDAEAADAFATASPTRGSSSRGEGGKVAASSSYFEVGKRGTVIGPRIGQNGKNKSGQSSAREESGVTHPESDTEDFSLDPRENRRTVIGPSVPATLAGKANVTDTTAFGQDEREDRLATSGGAEREEEEEEEEEEDDVEDDLEDDSMVSQPIDDKELRRISRQAQAVVG